MGQKTVFFRRIALDKNPAPGKGSLPAIVQNADQFTHQGAHAKLLGLIPKNKGGIAMGQIPTVLLDQIGLGRPAVGRDGPDLTALLKEFLAQFKDRFGICSFVQNINCRGGGECRRLRRQRPERSLPFEPILPAPPVGPAGGLFNGGLIQQNSFHLRFQIERGSEQINLSRSRLF